MWRQSTDAWGSVLSTTGSVSTNRGYGGTHGTERTGSGLLDVGVRAYDPALGRFLQQDGVESLTGQQYGYAGSYPTGSVDPDGRARLLGQILELTDKTLRSRGLNVPVRVAGPLKVISGFGGMAGAAAFGAATAPEIIAAGGAATPVAWLQIGVAIGLGYDAAKTAPDSLVTVVTGRSIEERGER